jgi:predicted DNA-binding transcriptional regulator AlpA
MHPKQRRLIDSKQVEARVKLTRWTIERLEKKKKFPKHVNQVPGRKHWFEDEIDAHLERLAAERDQRVTA